MLRLGMEDMSKKKSHRPVKIDPRSLEKTRANLLQQMESIVRIAQSALDLTSTKATQIRLTASAHGAASGGDPQVAVQVTCNVDFEDGSSACYEDPPGVCCPGPCPC